jgi:anti-sigma factor RsiW
MKLFRRDMACREVVEVVTDYLEGKLSARDRRLLERHLTGCDGCGAYIEQMRTTISLTGRLEPEDVPAELDERVLVAFREWRGS